MFIISDSQTIHDCIINLLNRPAIAKKIVYFLLYFYRINHLFYQVPYKQINNVIKYKDKNNHQLLLYVVIVYLKN